MGQYKRLWIGYWLVLFTIMHVPISGTGPINIEDADKIVHFSAYFLLVWLGGCRLLATARPRLVLVVIIWAAVYAAYAGIDEWLQSFVGRTMSLTDWFADLTGILAATALLVLLRPGPSATLRWSPKGPPRGPTGA